MKEVTAFMTDDNQIFRTQQAAQRHEALLTFRKWFEDNPLLGNVLGSTVEYEVLLGWLSNNRDEVLTVLQEAL